jgi:hypothetical protein
MMVAVDPFWMKDKVGPDDDNDPDEVIRAANAADELTGRRKPPRSINALDEDEAFDSIRFFQESRDLEADGVVNPKGPTAQRIAGEQHARARRDTPPIFSSVLGRGARAPLWGSVGRGGQNLSRDVKVTKAALALAGQQVAAPSPRPDSNVDESGGTAAAVALKKFQEQHGLQPDGLMTPFGGTHDMIDTILAPRVEALVGTDPGNLKPFESRAPEIVAKTLKFRPSTTRTSFQDEDSLPTEAEHQAATDLMGVIAEDMEQAVSFGTMENSEAENYLASDLSDARGDDSLRNGSRQTGLQVDVPEAEPSRKVELLRVRHRIAALDPDLTDRQLDVAAREAVEHGVDLLSDDKLRAWSGDFRRKNHDYHQDFQDLIEKGKQDTEGLEKKLSRLMRDRVSATGNRDRGRRIAAAMNVLAEQYVAEAKAEGFEIDADGARKQVERLAKAAITGEIDTDALGEILLGVLDFVPVVGEFKSAYEAIDLYQKIMEAEAKEPPEDTSALYADFSLAVFGAVPFLGKGIKAIKLGRRAKGAVDRVKSTKLYKKLDQQVAGRQLLNLTDNGKLDTVSAKGLFDEAEWKAFDAETREAFELSLRVAKKRGSEKRLRDILDRSALHVPIEERRLIRYDVEVETGVWKTRNYDGVAMGKLTKRLGGLVIRKSDDNKTWVYEMKVDGAGLSRRQREIDMAVVVRDRKRVGRKAKKAKGELPEFEQDIQYLRMPMYALPKEELIQNVRSTLGNVPKGAADELVERIEVGYEAALQLRRAGRIDLAAKITLGATIGITMLGSTQTE